MYSPHQTQYFAWQLTRRLSSEDEDKLTGAIMDAQIDLNPHQVDAALFAFKNPLNKGVLLADEVGLGKTIRSYRKSLALMVRFSNRPTTTRQRDRALKTPLILVMVWLSAPISSPAPRPMTSE